MADTVTEVTTQSYGSRVKNSCSGLCWGPVMILAGIVLLVWNEANAVAHHRSLDQGESNTISVLNITSIDTANEGKLIHVSGAATTSASIQDDVFGVAAPGGEFYIKLQRSSMMYQWTESSQSQTETNLGGSTTTTTTYTYEKQWMSTLVSSTSFNKPQGHENPTVFPYPADTFTASPINFGAYVLPEAIVDSMSWLSNYDGPLNVSQIPDAKLRNQTTVISGPAFYVGNNSANPQVGDTQVSFTVLKAPQTMSIVAVQIGNTFAPYTAKAGRSILLVQPGVKTQAQMYEEAHDNVTTVAWVLRFVGFLVIWFGLIQIMGPLTTMADVVPFCGNMLETITCWVLLPVALFISLFFISLAWLAVRPLLLIPILAVVGGAGYLLHRHNKQKGSDKNTRELPEEDLEKPSKKEEEPDVQVVEGDEKV